MRKVMPLFAYRDFDMYWVKNLFNYLMDVKAWNKTHKRETLFEEHESVVDHVCWYCNKNIKTEVFYRPKVLPKDFLKSVDRHENTPCCFCISCKNHLEKIVFNSREKKKKGGKNE